MTLDQDEPLEIRERLKREIDSWRPYAEALRKEDRDVFRDMMNAASSYREAIDLAERGYDTEALLMSIILNQQKAVNWLSNLARRIREEKTDGH